MRIVAKTLLWLREQPYEAGTEFAVVETVDPAATDPVEVDAGTASLWLRRDKAGEVSTVPSPGASAPPSPQRGEGKKVRS